MTGPDAGDGVGLRRAGSADADAITAVWWRARQASAPAIPLPVHSLAEVRAWFTGVVLPAAEVWVAEEAGAVVGLLVLADGWVEQLYVDPARTGRGIGGRLLARARTRRPGGLQLWVFAANIGARRFYERHGFAAVEHTDGRGNEEGAPDVRYRWPGVGAGGSPD